jgi:hypothetical protein
VLQREEPYQGLAGESIGPARHASPPRAAGGTVMPWSDLVRDRWQIRGTRPLLASMIRVQVFARRAYGSLVCGGTAQCERHDDGGGPTCCDQYE